MKNFIKSLAVVFAMYFIGSCAYDDKFIVEEHDGFSTVVKIDTVYSSEGNLGFQTSYYLDNDNVPGYSSGDRFQNSYTVWNGLNGKNGLDSRVNITRLEPNGDCSVGSLLIQAYQGANLINSIDFCLPINGTNGSNGFSPVMKVDSYNEGGLTGNLLSFFLDKDYDDEVSVGDSYMGGFIVFNGKNGINGQNGQSPKISFKVVESGCASGQSLVATSYLGEQLISTASFCIPRDGTNGTNGQNGFSPVMSIHSCIDDKGVVFGHLVEFFLDLDRDGVVSMEDSYMNGFFVRNGKDGVDGQDGQNGAEGKTVMVTFDIVESISCSSGQSMVFTSSLDGQIISQKSFCISIDGQDGTNGTNGFSPIVKSDLYYNSSHEVIGQVLSFYLDKDRNGIYSPEDTYTNSIIILNGINGQNGVDGEDGVDGKTVMVTFDIVESSSCSSGQSMVFTSSLDGQIISQKSFCIPKDGIDGTNGTNGTNGLTPSLETRDHGCSCTLYRWYLDLNVNGVYESGDTLISEDIICDGKDGNPATALVTLTLEYDFQAAGTSYFNSTGFLLNGFVLNDGALYLPNVSGYVSLPPLSNNTDLLSLRFNYGSKMPYNITAKVIYADNSEAVVKTVHLSGNPAFQRNIYSTYSSFEYYADINLIAFKDVKRIKIEATKDTSSKCVDADLFVDQIIIGLLDRNH
jgi:hypothetical protein